MLIKQKITALLVLIYNKYNQIFNLYFLKIVFKKFISIKNKITLILIFITDLCIRLFFKSIEIKFGLFESDLIFCLSSLTSISIASFIRKYRELIHIP